MKINCFKFTERKYSQRSQIEKHPHRLHQIFCRFEYIISSFEMQYSHFSFQTSYIKSRRKFVQCMPLFVVSYKKVIYYSYDLAFDTFIQILGTSTHTHIYIHLFYTLNWKIRLDHMLWEEFLFYIWYGIKWIVKYVIFFVHV